LGNDTLHGGSNWCKKVGERKHEVLQSHFYHPRLGPKRTALYNYREKQEIITMSLNCKWRTSSTKKKQNKSYFSRKENCAQVARLKQSMTETNSAQGLDGADSLRSRVPGKRKIRWP
jgi:hypothetical protein